MTCAWQELLAVLPLWMRQDTDRFQKDPLREIRMRINAPPELIFPDKSLTLRRKVTQDDLQYTVNAASRYSPWASASAAKGYITAKGGHRIGLCGEAVSQQGEITAMRNYTSLCIRVARDVPGIAERLSNVKGSVLILGAPGWGKTTLLRDMIRQLGRSETVCVADDRGELFPKGFDRGPRTDVVTGCSKEAGISMLLRAMGPDCIAVDEITDPADTSALLQAANCGVRLLASAHATAVSDFERRIVYRPLVENHVFDVIIVLKKNQSYTMERMTQWVTDGSAPY